MSAIGMKENIPNMSVRAEQEATVALLSRRPAMRRAGAAASTTLRYNARAETFIILGLARQSAVSVNVRRKGKSHAATLRAPDTP